MGRVIGRGFEAREQNYCTEMVSVNLAVRA